MGIIFLFFVSGEIVNALDRLHLSQNTLVYFSSDQGGHLEEMSATGAVVGGNNGIYKGELSLSTTF